MADDSDLHAAIRHEIVRWLKGDHEEAQISFDERNLCDIKVFIDGPPNSGYEGGTFELDVHFPKRFPSQPPTVRFKTKIFHLNVTDKGRIFLDTLYSNWIPGISKLGDIIDDIIGMLENGGENKDHPANDVAADYYNGDIEEYKKEVARQTREFAIATKNRPNVNNIQIEQKENDKTSPSSILINNGEQGSAHQDVNTPPLSLILFCFVFVTCLIFYFISFYFILFYFFCVFCVFCVLLCRLEFTNPLVGMIGIGQYKQGEHIIGVDIDYKNMEQLFGEKFGYTIYFDKDSQGNYRQHWKTSKIKRYINSIRKKLSSNDGKNKYDGLIFIITGDGDTNRNEHHCLMTSDGNEYDLENLYSSFYGKNCKELINKAKLFLLDCSRGGLAPNKFLKPEDIKKMQPKIYHTKKDLRKKELIFRIYSTGEGDKALRSDKNGGYLINGLKNVIIENSLAASSVGGSDIIDYLNRGKFMEMELNDIFVDLFFNVREETQKQLVEMHSIQGKSLILKHNNNNMMILKDIQELQHHTQTEIIDTDDQKTAVEFVTHVHTQDNKHDSVTTAAQVAPTNASKGKIDRIDPAGVADPTDTITSSVIRMREDLEDESKETPMENRAALLSGMKELLYRMRKDDDDDSYSWLLLLLSVNGAERNKSGGDLAIQKVEMVLNKLRGIDEQKFRVFKDNVDRTKPVKYAVLIKCNTQAESIKDPAGNYQRLLKMIKESQREYQAFYSVSIGVTSVFQSGLNENEHLKVYQRCLKNLDEAKQDFSFDHFRASSNSDNKSNENNQSIVRWDKYDKNICKLNLQEKKNVLMDLLKDEYKLEGFQAYENKLKSLAMSKERKDFWALCVIEADTMNEIKKESEIAGLYLRAIIMSEICKICKNKKFSNYNECIGYQRGGEDKFAILIDCATKIGDGIREDDANKIVDKLFKKIAKETEKVDIKKRIIISVGITLLKPGETWRDWEERAIDALGKAKRLKDNCRSSWDNENHTL